MQTITEPQPPPPLRPERTEALALGTAVAETPALAVALTEALALADAVALVVDVAVVVVVEEVSFEQARAAGSPIARRKR